MHRGQNLTVRESSGVPVVAESGLWFQVFDFPLVGDKHCQLTVQNENFPS